MSVSLNEICELIVDCPHSTAFDEGSGYPLIRTPNIGPGYFDLEGVHRVGKAAYDKRNQRAVPRPNDLILAREAPAGNVAIIPGGAQFCLGQRTVLIRPDASKVCPLFLNYYLNAPEQRHKLLRNANGATVSHVNMPIIRNLPVDLPPIDEQERIASILSAYDALIESNRKQIKLLEEAAQRLYKEWFIDLRFPGHENTEIDSETGLPEDWQEVALRNALEAEIGGGWGEEMASAEYSEMAYVIRATDIIDAENGNLSGIPLRFHKSSNLESRSLRHGDLVFEVSGGSRDHGVGRNLRITDDLLGQLPHPIMCASFCKKMRPKSMPLSLIIAESIRYAYLSDGLRAFEKRSAGNIINFHWNEFLDNFYLRIPPAGLLETYINLIEQIHKAKSMKANTVRVAREARDRLLPRLISEGREA
ncbi:restriction endonuclease subunit S [Adlercreutzia sp. R21]|uniref:restriction endonuclease subunit S n=1 Tax=Adlercreutzia wanghongyangiae TaxID=3111451 RepID=UPI002DBAEBC4|nr:restriction endonuclease subunit S [Adlercreutzia sp. R21]MEC4185100.1 restriction endonuclease subunit S [Adlercreutzia sp. R21]